MRYDTVQDNNDRAIPLTDRPYRQEQQYSERPTSAKRLKPKPIPTDGVKDQDKKSDLTPPSKVNNIERVNRLKTGHQTTSSLSVTDDFGLSRKKLSLHAANLV